MDQYRRNHDEHPRSPRVASAYDHGPHHLLRRRASQPYHGPIHDSRDQQIH